MGNLTQATSIKTMERIVQGTAVNSTSGTSIDFTGIPSWVKRITVMFNGVSTNGVSQVQVQIGAGSIDTTGYVGSTATISTGSTSTVNLSTGFRISGTNDSAGTTRQGCMILTNLNSNIWSLSGSMAASDGPAVYLICGTKTLSGTLDRIRITTVNGTDTFDAGQINIMYEG